MMKAVEQHQRLAFTQIQKLSVNSAGKIVPFNSDCLKRIVLRYIPLVTHKSKREYGE